MLHALESAAMKAIRAVYEDRVFRPLEAAELPEHCHVEFEPRIIDAEPLVSSLDDLYAILSERGDSGESDVAARHNEHQP
jgi:predicted DNA-binding antitoxin AbrB/MazE fold protein